MFVLSSEEAVFKSGGRRLQTRHSFLDLFCALEEKETVIGLFYCYRTNEMLAPILEREEDFLKWERATEAGTHRADGFYAVPVAALGSFIRK